VATVIFAFGNFLMIMVSMSLFGIAQMLVMSGAMALTTDLVQPVNRGKVVGFNNFVGYIVMGLGMLLGSYLYENFIPQSPFYVTVGVTVAASFMVLFLVHEPKKRVGAITSA